MNFGDFEIEVQENILKLLDSHISTSIDLIKSDDTLLPVLLLPDSKQLISLQPKDKIIDVDKAYASIYDFLCIKNVFCLPRQKTFFRYDGHINALW